MDEKAIRRDERLVCISILMAKVRNYAIRSPHGIELTNLAEEIAREIEAHGN